MADWFADADLAVDPASASDGGASADLVVNPTPVANPGAGVTQTITPTPVSVGRLSSQRLTPFPAQVLLAPAAAGFVTSFRTAPAVVITTIPAAVPLPIENAVPANVTITPTVASAGFRTRVADANQTSNPTPAAVGRRTQFLTVDPYEHTRVTAANGRKTQFLSGIPTVVTAESTAEGLNNYTSPAAVRVQIQTEAISHLERMVVALGTVTSTSAALAISGLSLPSVLTLVCDGDASELQGLFFETFGIVARISTRASFSYRPPVTVPHQPEAASQTNPAQADPSQIVVRPLYGTLILPNHDPVIIGGKPT